jgi:Leucine-rich repeat (LRR) protein
MKKIFALTLALLSSFSVCAETRFETCVSKSYAMSSCGLSDADVPEIINYLQKYPPGQNRYLVLNDNQITDKGLLQIIQNIPVKLIMIGNNKITDEGVAALARLPDLLDVDLHGNQITDKGGVLLAGVKSLWGIDLSNTRITDITAKAIAKSRRRDLLSMIRLDNDGITDEGAIALSKCGGMQMLKLRGNRITDIGASWLAENSYQIIDLSHNDIGDKGALAIMQSASRAVLSYNHVTDAAVITFFNKQQYISNYVLDLEGNLLTDHSAHALAGVVGANGRAPFSILAIGNNQITLAGLQQIVDARLIADNGILSVKKSHYGDKLAEMIGHSSLTGVYLSDNDITDDGIAKLVKNRSFKYLALENNKITDAGFNLLLNHSYEMLYLAGNRITEAGIKKLYMTDTYIKNITIRDNQISEEVIQAMESHKQIGKVMDLQI